MDHIDVRLQLTADSCRHPDGMEAGDSVCAEANCDSCHYDLVSRPPAVISDLIMTASLVWAIVAAGYGARTASTS